MARTMEPDTAPPADTYFPLMLGPTILESTPARFYSLRYEFKPASIDTGSPGTLHKGVENKVTVEFSNNQAGKPKVAFQGNSEDCKDMDAVIFFDGQNFRLERLHRAVKSLRHLRQGETAAALAGSGSGSGLGAVSPIHANGGHNNAEKNAYKAHHIMETITDEPLAASKPEVAPAPAAKKGGSAKKKGGSSKATNKRQSPIDVKEASPEIDIDEFEVPEPEPDIEPERDPEPEPKKAKQTIAPPLEEVDVVGEDDEEILEVLEEHSDYEIEDVDVSEDEEADGGKSGSDPAATLRAQAAAAAGNKSSSDSGSSSSDSGSGSSSSESGSDDEDSASSGDDI